MATDSRAIDPDHGPVLSIRNLSKSFGGTRALDQVSFDVGRGEVHGLVGENGSGKSTLIKVLSGFHTPEPGSEVTVAGRPASLPLSTVQLQDMGLRFVHQDLALVPTLTVTENLFVDELSTRPSWLLRASVQRRRARDELAPFGRPLDPAAKVGSLSAADQAHLAIVRAISELRQHRTMTDSQPGVLVLDEVTAFLPAASRAQLFQLIRDVVAQGDSVLFVSHYLDEVLEITSNITVLRDGKLVRTLPTAQITVDGLVELVIGRALLRTPTGSSPVDPAPPDAEAAPSVATHGVTDLNSVVVSGLTGDLVQNLDLVIHDGEIVGVTGLLGSGFEEVPALLFGAQRARSGRMRLQGRDVDLTTLDPRRATMAGMAFVPEDRNGAGGVGSLDVEENLTLQILDRYRTGSTLSHRRLRRATTELLEEYDVRPRNPRAKMAELSGGNQQKVILAKWLSTNPSLLLLHEPTHGVDVGSREQLLLRIRAAARSGVAVLCASSDPEQLSELCDRVLILVRGGVVAELSGGELTKDLIVERSYQAAPGAEPTDSTIVRSS